MACILCFEACCFVARSPTFVNFSLSGAGSGYCFSLTGLAIHTNSYVASLRMLPSPPRAAPPNPQISLAQFLEEATVDGYQGVPRNEIGCRSFGPSHSIAKGGRGQGIRFDIGTLLGEISRAI